MQNSGNYMRNYNRFRFANESSRSILGIFDTLRIQIHKNLPGVMERLLDYGAVYQFEGRPFCMIKVGKMDFKVFLLDVPADPELVLPSNNIGYAKYMKVRIREHWKYCFEVISKCYKKVGGNDLPTETLGSPAPPQLPPPPSSQVIPFPTSREFNYGSNQPLYDADSPVPNHLLENPLKTYKKPVTHRPPPPNPRDSILGFLKECKKFGPMGLLCEILGSDQLVYFLSFSNHYYVYYNDRIFKTTFLMINDQGNCVYKFIDRVQDLNFEFDYIKETGVLLPLKDHIRTLNYFIYGYV